MMQNFDALPDSALVRMRQLSQVIPLHRTTFWKRVKAGTFPAPVRFAEGRCTAWRVGDVRAWLAAQGSPEKAA